jgi:hypothetical protein
MYRDLIREDAAALGYAGADPRHIEAWMRLEHSTLDILSREQFRTEVGVAITCMRLADVSESEALADSFGLPQSDRYVVVDVAGDVSAPREPEPQKERAAGRVGRPTAQHSVTTNAARHRRPLNGTSAEQREQAMSASEHRTTLESGRSSPLASHPATSALSGAARVDATHRVPLLLDDEEHDESDGWQLCGGCNGSGEGRADGTRCYTCKGRGEVRV